MLIQTETLLIQGVGEAEFLSVQISLSLVQRPSRREGKLGSEVWPQLCPALAQVDPKGQWEVESAQLLDNPEPAGKGGN